MNQYKKNTPIFIEQEVRIFHNPGKFKCSIHKVIKLSEFCEIINPPRPDIQNIELRGVKQVNCWINLLKK